MNKLDYIKNKSPTFNSSSLHSLCIEAGFNETELVSVCTPSNPQNKTKIANLEEEIVLLKIKNEDLKDQKASLGCQIFNLEKEIAYLKKQNEIYDKELKSQKANYDILAEKAKEFEAFMNGSKDKGAQMNELGANGDSAEIMQTSDMEKRQAEVESKVNSLLTDIPSINKKVEVCSSYLTDISKVVYKLESEVQKFFRRHSLVIENLCPKEDSSAMEMLIIFAKSVLNVTLEDYDIESLQIIEKVSTEPTPGTPEKRTLPRPVLITFSCFKKQAEIYKSWLSFRCKNTPGSLSKERGQGITIKEYLTEKQEDVYKEALKLKEKHMLVDCWTYKGKTYIKKLDGSVSEFSNSSEIVLKSESSSCTMM